MCSMRSQPQMDAIFNDDHRASHQLHKTCAQKLIQHDLEMPHAVGHPPKSDQDIKLVINYSRLFNLDPELCQDELCHLMQIALHCTMELPGGSNQRGHEHFDVGQPRFYGCYFVAPTGETQVEVKVETQDEAEEETPNLTNRVDKMLLDKCVRRNCAICLRCMAREQIGTIWCYTCGQPMLMQKAYP